MKSFQVLSSISLAPFTLVKYIFQDMNNVSPKLMGELYVNYMQIILHSSTITIFPTWTSKLNQQPVADENIMWHILTQLISAESFWVRRTLSTGLFSAFQSILSVACSKPTCVLWYLVVVYLTTWKIRKTQVLLEIMYQPWLETSQIK